MPWTESAEPRVARGRDPEPVVQFSLFLPNRLGRLHETASRLSDQNIHVLALTALDTTDSAIIRLIVDDPEGARAVFAQTGAPYTVTDILVVELDFEHDLKGVLSALLEAELNIHYTYPFLVRPAGKAALAVSLEHPDVAADALRRRNFSVLYQNDLSR